MKTFIRQLRLWAAVLLLAGFTSCEDDNYDLKHELFGRTWVGDIGMNAEFGERLYSEFHFDPDGFGEEYQYYWNGDFYQRYRFQWYWESPYSNNMVLDYGSLGVSYMDDVYVGRGRMTGVFYLDDYSEGFPFVLEMW